VQGLAWCRRQYQRAPDDAARHLLDCDTRYEMYRGVMDAHDLGGALDYLEFGVYRGASLAWWAQNNQHPDTRLYGFDTFTGLPEPWGALKEGTYTAHGKLPEIGDARVSFIVGLFQNTLSGFLNTYRPRRKVIHIDADLYTSTMYVLTRLAPYLCAGDVLIFDEFLAWKYPDHEFRALLDFAASYQVKHVLVGGADHFAHVAVKLL
jgi:hypothetical protein